ncbi:MAG: amidohydrolase [Anaerolineae bacterium]|nr:amidohydrolase [Anaerolineae bacterium]
MEEAQQLFDYTQSIRRDLHRHPELGFQEKRTANLIAEGLSRLGMEVLTGIAQTGVVGFLEGHASEPIALLRFDMDALPIQEENKVDYASTHAGVMHACGHDGHVATGLTVAKLLKKYQNQLSGTVQFVFQPAEEGLGGAHEMIKAGVFTRPKPKYCLAFHLWNERPVGWFGVVSGPVMASSDAFTIDIKGRGGHGAIPDQAIDPVVVVAQLIMAMQTIISRNVSPLESAVLSIGQVNCGNTHNVIPDKVAVKGTIRVFTPRVREHVLNRLQAVCDGLALGFNCEIALVVEKLTPPVINNQEIAQLVGEITREIFKGAVIESDYRTMASEDFSYFLEEVPGCLILVGSRNDQKGFLSSHHNPKFDFDEQALTNAAALLAATVLRISEFS